MNPNRLTRAEHRRQKFDRYMYGEYDPTDDEWTQLAEEWYEDDQRAKDDVKSLSWHLMMGEPVTVDFVLRNPRRDLVTLAANYADIEVCRVAQGDGTELVRRLGHG
jgi:hypothetical protein